VSTNPTRHKFLRQRWHAKDRGIEWHLTYEQWLVIWLESGHWHQRGNRVGCYVMARHGDTGPYAVGNVSIITCSQNISEAERPERTLPRGVYYPSNSTTGYVAKRSVGGKHVYLGTFRTPEEAHAAYLRAA
jgi:hypothetical protein